MSSNFEKIYLFVEKLYHTLLNIISKMKVSHLIDKTILIIFLLILQLSYGEQIFPTKSRLNFLSISDDIYAYQEYYIFGKYKYDPIKSELSQGLHKYCVHKIPLIISNTSLYCMDYKSRIILEIKIQTPAVLGSFLNSGTNAEFHELFGNILVFSPKRFSKYISADLFSFEEKKLICSISVYKLYEHKLKGIVPASKGIIAVIQKSHQENFNRTSLVYMSCDGKDFSQVHYQGLEGTADSIYSFRNNTLFLVKLVRKGVIYLPFKLNNENQVILGNPLILNSTYPESIWTERLNDTHFFHVYKNEFGYISICTVELQENLEISQTGEYTINTEGSKEISVLSIKHVKNSPYIVMIFEDTTYIQIDMTDLTIVEFFTSKRNLALDRFDNSLKFISKLPDFSIYYENITSIHFLNSTLVTIYGNRTFNFIPISNILKSNIVSHSDFIGMINETFYYGFFCSSELGLYKIHFPISICSKIDNFYHFEEDCLIIICKNEILIYRIITNTYQIISLQDYDIFSAFKLSKKFSVVFGIDKKDKNNLIFSLIDMEKKSINSTKVLENQKNTSFCKANESHVYLIQSSNDFEDSLFILDLESISINFIAKIPKAIKLVCIDIESEINSGTFFLASRNGIHLWKDSILNNLVTIQIENSPIYFEKVDSAKFQVTVVDKMINLYTIDLHALN